MKNFTKVNIRPEYLEKLKTLAESSKRSMTRQLEVLIDNAPDDLI